MWTSGLFVLAAACGGAPEPEFLQMGGGIQGIVHPTEAGRLSSHTDAPVGSVTLPEKEATALPAELAPLAHFDETSAVGLLEATDEAAADLVFGTLVDAEIAPDGSILLLDHDYSMVRVLSPSLEPTQTFGGEGQGPGEFDGPRSLMWLAPDELGVFQRGRIEAFRSVDGVYEHSRRLAISAVPNPDAACTTGETLHFTGIRFSMGDVPVTRDGLTTGQFSPDEATIQSETIHELALDGELVRSYSTPYRGDLPYDSGMDRFHLALNYAGGQIDCDVDRVWAGYSLLGEVHSFDDDGRLTWISRIADLGHPGLLYTWDASGARAGRSGSINVDIERGGYAIPWLSRITHVDGNVLAAQVTRTRYGPVTAGERQSAATTYPTYLLDPDDGHLLGGFTADHQILAGRNGMAILYREEPFPQISLVRLEN